IALFCEVMICGRLSDGSRKLALKKTASQHRFKLNISLPVEKPLHDGSGSRLGRSLLVRWLPSSWPSSLSFSEVKLASRRPRLKIKRRRPAKPPAGEVFRLRDTHKKAGRTLKPWLTLRRRCG